MICRNWEIGVIVYVLDMWYELYVKWYNVYLMKVMNKWSVEIGICFFVLKIDVWGFLVINLRFNCYMFFLLFYMICRVLRIVLILVLELYMVGINELSNSCRYFFY